MTVLADLETPTSLLLKLASFQPAFLLESSDHSVSNARYSFIGLLPSRVIRIVAHEDFRARVQQELDAIPDTASGLAGALVGSVTFEAAYRLHPTGVEIDPNAEIARFVVPTAVLKFDHHRRTVSVSHRDGETEAQKLLTEIRRASALSPALPDSRAGASSAPTASLSRDAFHDAVKRAKQYIYDGDIFQAVLASAFSGETDITATQAYRALRHLNPSPYQFYLNLGDRTLVGASPEALVRLEDNNLTVRPIAGTRPRSDLESADIAFEQDLLADPKENAEHNMLVDLARNDIGRVAEIGSVRTPVLRRVERYSHVMHLCSTVTGRFHGNPVDAFISAFPAGTVSGAPKIRALQIIRELEPVLRGDYAGAVGYIGKNQSMDFAITIRTLELRQGRYRIQAGAGIVADSDPRREFEEIQNKSRVLFEALKFAKEQL